MRKAPRKPTNGSPAFTLQETRHLCMTRPAEQVRAFWIMLRQDHDDEREQAERVNMRRIVRTCAARRSIKLPDAQT